MQLPIALYIMASPAFSTNRLYSNTALSHALTTISSGYFLYDVRAWKHSPMHCPCISSACGELDANLAGTDAVEKRFGHEKNAHRHRTSKALPLLALRSRVAGSHPM